MTRTHMSAVPQRTGGAANSIPAGLTMTDSVHRRLSADIVSGRLAPGDPLQGFPKRADTDLVALFQHLEALIEELRSGARGRQA